MRFRSVAALVILPILAFPAWSQDLYRDPHAGVEARVSDLLDRLTLDEKISLLNGTSSTTNPVPRLGIPPMEMVDSGEGVFGGSKDMSGPATQFPGGVEMCSTWDPALIGRMAEAIGVEVHNKGTGASVLLGPAVNLARSPFGGRNGEFLGEDPYLNARMAVAYIQGIQRTGVGACIKHYVCNNEESDRGQVNVTVSQRALFELYFPVFFAAVTEAHTWAIMAAYNSVNGHYMTANHYLLTDVLKRGWKFDGTVISDWGAVHEPAAVPAGTDLEMPGPRVLTPAAVHAALDKQVLTENDINEAVRRLLRLMVRVGLLDGSRPKPDHSLVDSPDHREIAYQVATEGIVLLKNEKNVLPLRASVLHSIALVGHGVHDMMTAAPIGGDDRPAVSARHVVSLEEGLRQEIGGATTLVVVDTPYSNAVVPASALTPAGDPHGSGLHAEYFQSLDMSGKPDLTRTDATVNLQKNAGDHSIRWTGTLQAPQSGNYELAINSASGVRLYLDGRLLIDSWKSVLDTGVLAASQHYVSVALEAGQSHPLRIEAFQNGQPASVRFGWHRHDDTAEVEAARHADVALVCVTTHGDEGEAHDRTSYHLPHFDEQTIRDVAAVNRHTIVILNNGTPISCKDWIDQVPGIIEAWYPGEEAGHALADIIFGKVNPSGKLPVTFGAKREDYPDYSHFPGDENGQVNYAEGIYVGYRHFDKANIAPQFPFGYGLSYTTFQYADLRLSKPMFQPGDTTQATVRITNTGQRAGDEVAELYVHDLAPRIDKPVRELKGFARVSLQPGESKTVTFTITPRDLAYCDVNGRQWKADAGDYAIEVGHSSRDLTQKATLQLAHDFTDALPYLNP